VTVVDTLPPPQIVNQDNFGVVACDATQTPRGFEFEVPIDLSTIKEVFTTTLYKSDDTANSVLLVQGDFNNPLTWQPVYRFTARYRPVTFIVANGLIMPIGVSPDV
jgi:hypothetical protein